MPLTGLFQSFMMWTKFGNNKCKDILHCLYYIDIARAHTGNWIVETVTILSNIAKIWFCLGQECVYILPHTNFATGRSLNQFENISGSQDIASVVVHKNSSERSLFNKAGRRKQIMHQYMIYMGIPQKFIWKHWNPANYWKVNDQTQGFVIGWYYNAS